MDKKISKLERQEKELLDRLKNSQAMEQEVFKKLEEAIKESENSYQN